MAGVLPRLASDVYSLDESTDCFPSCIEISTSTVLRSNADVGTNVLVVDFRCQPRPVGS